MKIVITACELYIKNLISAVNSCLINYPQGDVIIRLVNCSDETTNRIQTKYKNLRILSVAYGDDPTRKNLNKNGALLQDELFNVYNKKSSEFKGARWLYSDLMARIINDRYSILIELLEAGAECVLSIDADTIIRGDLTELKQNILSNDIALHGEIVKDGSFIDFGDTIRYEDVPILNRYQYNIKETSGDINNYVEWHTGVIGFNNTPASLKFLKEYTNILLKKENIHVWGAEEEEVYFLYLKHHKEIKIYNIPIKFKDEGYGTDRIVGSDQYNVNSHIWVGAGQNKYNCNSFTSEVNKYSEPA